MASKKIKEFKQATTVNDTDVMVLESATETQQVRVSTLKERIIASIEKLTKKVKLEQDYYVHSARGTIGTAGYIHIAQIKISGSSQDAPVEFYISQRGTIYNTKVLVKFANEANADPELAGFVYEGSNGGIYLYKSATSTWDLYVLKKDNCDGISIMSLKIPAYLANISVTWKDAQSTSVPDGSVKAVLATNNTNVTGNSGTTTKLLTSKTINGVNFDGTANISINSVVPTSVTGLTVDLNDYNRSGGHEQGSWRCTTTGGAANISNLPSSKDAFLLILESPRAAGATDYVQIQTLYYAYNKTKYQRWCVSGEWNAWKLMETHSVTETAKNVSGIVALENGGTGATTAAAARANLGAVGSEELAAKADCVNGTVIATTVLAYANSCTRNTSIFVVISYYPSDLPVAGEGLIEVLVGFGGRKIVRFTKYSDNKIYNRSIFSGAWNTTWTAGV